jgi:putative copper export protein
MEHISFQLWFAVRYVHVASIAILTGGALLVYIVCALRRPAPPEAALTMAAAYEWVFWLIAGVTIATGVSNLGLKGAGLPGAETQWGKALLVKLGGVLFLLVLSAVRADYVVRCQAAGIDVALDAERVNRVLRALYGLTTAVLLGAVWLGLGLAHGGY